MPTIARIRFGNVVYENRQKRYNDETFNFDGHNGAILLENGGGKTVFIQTLLQAVIPHLSLTGRKIKDTLALNQSPAHIAVEWILNENPRVYALTAVTLFLKNEELNSYKYTYRYTPGDKQSIDHLPFTVLDAVGRKRPATAEEMHDYYMRMNGNFVNAHLFADISEYTNYLESDFKLIHEEWASLATINTGEGDVAKFFEACKTTNDLVKKLLIPTVLLATNHGDEASFTKMFEEKRVNLRKSKQLKQQIQENQGVEQRVGKIMRVYEAQHSQQVSHVALQQQGKSYYTAAKKSQQELVRQLAELQVRQGSLREEEKLLNEQLASLEIADLQAEEDIGLADYEDKNSKYQASSERLTILEQEKQQLEYLRVKQDLESKAAQLHEEEESLRSQEIQQQDSDILATLRFIHCQLRSVYDEKEQLHRVALSGLVGEQVSVQEEIQELQTAINKEDGQRQEVAQQQVRHQTRLEFLKTEQDKIALQILPNVKEQQVEIEVVKWKKEAEYVQQALVDNMLLKNKKVHEQLEKSQQVTACRSEETEIRLKLEKVESRLDENQRKHLSVLSKLHNIPGLRTIESIYIDQGKIQAALSIIRDRRSTELAVARQQERRDFKLVDAYGQQKKFTFDAHVASFLQTCNCVVESGTAYTERLIAGGYATREDLLAHFPLWPMAVVVQENDKREVESKLSRGTSGLTSPVFIMTTTEARAAVAGAYPTTTIWPDFWAKVLEEKSFAEWKNLFIEQARESQLERETKEEAWQELDALYRNLEDFLQAYSQVDFIQCQQDKIILQDNWTLLKVRINLGRKEEQEVSRALENCQQAMSDLNGRASAVHTKLEKANEWQQKERARLAEEITLAQCQQQLIDIVTQLQVFKKEQLSVVARQEQLAVKIAVRKDALSLLMGEELYLQLQNYEPADALLPEEILKIKRSRLQEELAHLNLSITVIQDRIKTYRKEWMKFNRRLAEFSIQVPVDLLFPADGDVTLENLQIEVRRVQPEVQGDNRSMSDALRIYDNSRICREQQEKFYHGKFETQVHIFTEALSVVRERLGIHRLQVSEQLAVVEKSHYAVQQQGEQWGKLCTRMEMDNGKLEFLAESIPTLPLSGEDINSFPYESQLMTQQLLKKLETSHHQLVQGQSIVDKAKNTFESYCTHFNITNERMRQSILNGIRQKHEYQQMVEWEQELRQIIQAANRVAEQNMQAYNEDIKHFINQLHLHLMSICDEMAVIQKMTGVKIEEHYKCIYEIKTPIWDEASAKEKLLAHLEWMTDQLVSDKYKQEDGMEDNNKIRKNIEDWLSPSYLFTRISPNKSFTVGVRKVSNDNRISNTPVKWETSNSWSGGEKWSKNMALFLGIQSYLAEKRQPTRQSQHNTRTVVLDNPFGQASSDHVLEPIFFIAKKLGFQVIALTALAEGKFLRDYFPIIYSCRLRLAVGGETSVMDKDLYINHAFFQDNAPQTLTRLGQVQQLELL